MTAADGRLLATSFEMSVCETCDSVHIDLQGKDGEVFCSAIIAPESVREMGAYLIELANHIDTRNGKRLG